MEEEKAAAYYDELTRKGEGAARFKQGLGFSTSAPNDDVPKPGSALASSSSFLSKFVKASSTTHSDSEKQAQAKASAPSEPEKRAHLQSIHDKLKKKPSSESRVSSRDRDGDRSRRRSRSRERYRYRDSDRDRERERERGRRRSRSVSPRRQRRSDKDASDRGRVSETRKGRNAGTGIEYSKLIEGYDRMSSAERVKAKMKLQLSETAARDSEKGMGWERFEFNKDAPLDDEEIEVAEDDASLVKHIGQSFRFSAVEARREEQIQAAHEEAMFGATALPPSISTDSEAERENEKEVDKKELVTSLLSETVLAKQKGSWRDRVRQA
ncbi:E2F transcription factor E2FE [Spatholobus suberectus]|nr:E2F transcription factor E2FE [Spatholobus suberectus]